jgi:hypothetical protein
MPSRRRSSTRRRRGGASNNGYIPEPTNYKDASMMNQSLAQGNQFAQMHANQHGGFQPGPYPGSVTESSLPADLVASARLQPLNAAFDEIKGLRDPGQAGGKRRGKKMSRKAKKSKKSRKASKKSRKASKKSRKASKKSRKASKKSRKVSRRRRGGALGYMDVKAPGMLLDDAMYKQAGLNPEWELAKDPNAFAPVAPRS